MVSCVHRSAKCLIGHRHLIAQLIIRTLLQIPHRIAQVRPLCPDRVQVCAVFGNVDGILGEIGGCAVLGCGPADENVAVGGGEAQHCRRLYCCAGVGADVTLGIGFRSVVVSQLDQGRCLGVLGGEDHMACHLNGLAGFINFSAFIPPIQEPQIAVDGIQDRGIATALVDVVVNRSIQRILLDIGNLKGIHRSGEVGNQGYISIELGIRVEQRLCAVGAYGEPGAGRFAIIVLSDLLHQRLIAGGILQRGAVGNAQRFRRTVGIDRQINDSTELGGLPLGIEGDVLGGHGLAVEYESIALTGLVIIPAVKHVSLRHTVRPVGFIAHAAQRLLKLHGLRLFRSTVVDEDNVVAVAGVVELGAVVAFPDVGSPGKRKAGDGVLIFLCDTVIASRRSITMVQLVGNSALANRTSLSREHLYVIVCCFGAMARFRSVEALTVKGHNINIYLTGTAFLAGSPRTASIDNRPLVRNILTILRGNFQLIDR